MVCGASSQLRRSGCVPCICSWPLHWRGCRVHSIPEGNSRCEFLKNKSKLLPRNKRKTEDRRCRLLQKGCENRLQAVKVRAVWNWWEKTVCGVALLHARLKLWHLRAACFKAKSLRPRGGTLQKMNKNNWASENHSLWKTGKLLAVWPRDGDAIAVCKHAQGASERKRNNLFSRLW